MQLNFNKFITTKNEDQVEKYVTRLFQELERLPYKNRVENSVKKFEEKRDFKVRSQELVKTLILFGKLKNYGFM